MADWFKFYISNINIDSVRPSLQGMKAKKSLEAVVWLADRTEMESSAIELANLSDLIVNNVKRQSL